MIDHALAVGPKLSSLCLEEGGVIHRLGLLSFSVLPHGWVDIPEERVRLEVSFELNLNRSELVSLGAEPQWIRVGQPWC